MQLQLQLQFSSAARAGVCMHVRHAPCRLAGLQCTCTLRAAGHSDPAVQYTWIVAGVLSFVFCVGWPLLTIPAGVFSLGYYRFFVILSLIWALVSPLPVTLPSECNPCMQAQPFLTKHDQAGGTQCSRAPAGAVHAAEQTCLAGPGRACRASMLRA